MAPIPSAMVGGFPDAMPPQAMVKTLALSGPVRTATSSAGIG